jgi:hypothetical protein
VDIVATKQGSQSISKTMSLTKIQTGADGETPVIYNLSISPNRVTTNASGATTEQVVLTASVISTKGTTSTNVTTSTTDVIYYQWFVNGSNTAAKSGAGSSGYSYTIASGTTVSNVVCKIRKTNQSGTQVDSQSVAFVAKGTPGDTGKTGDGAIILSFPQERDTIGLNTDGTLAGDYDLTLPYDIYQGTSKLNSTASTSGTGYSFTINDIDFTGNNKGSITINGNNILLHIPAGVKVYDSTKSTHNLNGQCTIPITYTNATQTSSTGTQTTVSGTLLGTFSWNLDIAPENGTSVAVDSANSWIRYKLTTTASQPTITTSDATSVSAAIGTATKPYYVWSCNHVRYTDGNEADTYTVNYYPVDP